MNELYIIHNWRHAESLRESILKQCLRSTQMQPPTQLEWFESQGEIEWHNAAHPLWKKRCMQHMNDMNSYVNESSFFTGQRIIVVWNAQNISSIEWSLWKDKKNDVHTIFVSDRMIHQVRSLGIRVQSYPIAHENDMNVNLNLNKKILSKCLEQLLKNDWKGMIDLREHIIQYLEWNQSYRVIQEVITDLCMTQLQENDSIIWTMVSNGIRQLSNVENKIQCMMAVERVVILFLRCMEQYKDKNTS